MTFKKTDDIGRSTKISGERLKKEDILIEVEHSDVESYNPDEVDEKA